MHGLAKLRVGASGWVLTRRTLLVRVPIQRVPMVAIVVFADWVADDRESGGVRLRIPDAFTGIDQALGPPPEVHSREPLAGENCPLPELRRQSVHEGLTLGELVRKIRHERQDVRVVVSL